MCLGVAALTGHRYWRGRLSADAQYCSCLLKEAASGGIPHFGPSMVVRGLCVSVIMVSWWNLHMPESNDRAPFSTSAYFLSSTVSVRDAYAMGRSEPPGVVCEMTAPNPYGDASAARDGELRVEMG